MTFAELNKKYGVSISGGYNDEIKMVGYFKTDTDALGYMRELNRIPGYSQAFGRHPGDTSPVYPPVETNPQYRDKMNKDREGHIEVYVRFGTDGKRHVVFGKISKIVMVLEETKRVEYDTLAEYNTEMARRNELARKGDWDNIPGAELFTQFTSDDGTIVEKQGGVSDQLEIGSPAYRVICDDCNQTVIWNAEAVDANGNTKSGMNVYNLTQVNFKCETCTEKADAPYNEPVDFAYHR
jgi:hypothetical protein